jgi:hypothetical protein
MQNHAHDEAIFMPRASCEVGSAQFNTGAAEKLLGESKWQIAISKNPLTAKDARVAKENN